MEHEKLTFLHIVSFVEENPGHPASDFRGHRRAPPRRHVPARVQRRDLLRTTRGARHRHFHLRLAPAQRQNSTAQQNKRADGRRNIRQHLSRRAFRARGIVNFQGRQVCGRHAWRGTPLKLVWLRDGVGVLQTGEAVESRRSIRPPYYTRKSSFFYQSLEPVERRNRPIAAIYRRTPLLSAQRANSGNQPRKFA